MPLSCEFISDASYYFVPEFVELVAQNMAAFVRMLRAAGYTVTWVSENIAKREFIDAVLAAFGDDCQYAIISSLELSGESRTRAYFCLTGFDLSRFSAGIAGPPASKLFVSDVFPAADLIGSGSSGSNTSRHWRPASSPMPTFTSNCLYYLPHTMTRATKGRMVPLWIVALCRGLVVPVGAGIDVVAQRLGLARVVSGWAGVEFARQLCA
jgi:hypothetical protein